MRQENNNNNKQQHHVNYIIITRLQSSVHYINRTFYTYKYI